MRRDGARRLTCAALNQGTHPAVISGIMKLHATERMRVAVNDEFVAWDHALVSGDTVAFLPPMSGG